MRTFKKINLFISAATLVLLVACGHSGPETININKDDCDNCKMSISDKRFACELVTEKGRAYKFDDVTCMMSYKNDNKDKMTNAHFYINNYLLPNDLLLSDKLTFVEGENVSSPMGGNIAAFTNKDSAETYSVRWNAKIINWQTINQ